MNLDGPSSEHELSQDGSSANDSNENSVSFNTSKEQLNQTDLSDDPQVEAQLNNDSIDTTNNPSSTDSNQNIKALDTEARLQQLEKEHETLNSQYMRIAADFDNFRKRQTRDQDDLKIQLTCTTLSEILPVVDNFERARQQLNPESEEALALHRNYQNLYKQLVDVLKKLGVAPMRVVGQSFDPTLHEALLREPSETVIEDIILEELVPGYHLNGRVLRHAQVKVSMGPGPKTDLQNQEIDEDNQPRQEDEAESSDQSD